MDITINGKTREMTPEEVTAFDASRPSEEEIVARAKASAAARVRTATRIRVIEALVGADPDYQAAVAAIEKAQTIDEILTITSIWSEQKRT